jgi:tRNA nucleotidyltransferase/poly(A) polymerase
MKLSIKQSEDPYFQGALSVASRIHSKGFLVYFAGGCVRDAIMGRAPHDYDLVSTASPEQIATIFDKVIAVGESFGVTRVVFGEGQIYEVAQFRKESDYQDGRHPNLIAAASPPEDAFRRDFTMNALFWDPLTSEVIDFVGGIADINSSVIQTVGNPKVRFTEDYLRILRLFRFSAQLGFKIESSAYEQAAQSAEFLKKLSRERVHEEFIKFSLGKNRISAFLQMQRAQLFGALFLEVPARAELSQDQLVTLQHLEGLFFWAEVLLCLTGGNQDKALSALESLKISRQEKKDVVDYLWWRRDDIENERLGSLLERGFSKVFEINQAAFGECYKAKSWWGQLLVRRSQIVKKPEPLVLASDLSMYQGPFLGRALRGAYFLQLENPEMTKSQILAALQGFSNNGLRADSN